MMNKKYNIYFDPEIEGNDIVVCGIDDFKFGDRLCLINLWHITSGVVKSQIPETPDKPSGLYVGIMLSMELGIDTDGDVISVFDIDVVKINHPSTNSLNIEFRSNDPVIHNVILEQMAISLEKSEDRKKMNIAIYNHYERRIMFENKTKNVAGIGINLDALEEDPHAVSKKIGMAVQAVVEKYLLDLKDLKKLKNRGMEDNKTNENNKPYPVYPVYYDESIKDDNIVISIKDDNIIIPGIKDFKCGNPLFLLTIEKTVTGVVSEITINRDPGFYIGDHLASQLAIDIDRGGDVIRVMKIPMISNHNDG